MLQFHRVSLIFRRCTSGLPACAAGKMLVECLVGARARSEVAAQGGRCKVLVVLVRCAMHYGVHVRLGVVVLLLHYMGLVRQEEVQQDGTEGADGDG
ncbi:hypothetical protein D9M70_598370 [compost metagenome]